MGVTHQISHFFPWNWLDFYNRAKIILKYALNAQKILTENGRVTTNFEVSDFRRAGHLSSGHRVLFCWAYFGPGLTTGQPEGRLIRETRAGDVFLWAD